MLTARPMLSAREGQTLPADCAPAAPAMASWLQGPSTGDEDGHYRSIFENAVEGIYQTTVDGRYLRVNPALAQMYGYDGPDQLIVSLTDIAGQLYVDPTRRDDFARIMARDGVVTDFQAQVFRRDRSVIWIEENARCVRDRHGRILHYEGMVSDITARVASEEKIRLLATVFESVSEGILVVDRTLRVCAANQAFLTITGQDRERILGRPPLLSTPGFGEPGLIERICADADVTGHWRGELGCVRPDFVPFSAWLSVTTVRGPNDETEFFVLACSDVTERKQQEERIRYQANFDGLTTLPNRRLLHERLEQTIRLAAAGHERLAVAFLDLNRFKQVNDSLGHRAGDELLKQVARRLRSSCGASDTVGRYGGDEFVMIVPNVGERFSAAYLAEKLLYAFSDPFSLPERELYCSPSIGIAFYPDDAESADDLIRCADLAMYHTKRSAPQRFSLYTPEMRRLSVQRLDLEHDLRRAIQCQEFGLHYQPKIDLETGRVAGAEALIRWPHRSLGFVPPAEFIPVAEDTGQITLIGEWTLRQACRQAQDWRRAGIPLDTIAVNLSPRQFHDSGLVRMVRQCLDDTGLPPDQLELELTEGAMMVDMSRAVETLRRLKALGVRLAIDDFGTGYSSLAYLKRFPIDTLKIDRSFIHDIANNATDTAIIDTIIGLAGSLGFTVVAEGVETAEQALILMERNCRYSQGYLFCKPVPPERFAAYLQRLDREPWSELPGLRALSERQRPAVGQAG
ncbi:MAG: EAL domain-containing protein [Rhodospirillaceae bacterium]